MYVDIAIIGAGFGGLGMAVRLDQAGRRGWAIFEQADAVGGTWRDNVYPGAACDVPSHLYSFSFHLDPDWSRVYAPQEEIRRYLEGVADTFGLRDRIHLGRGVARARWDGRRWQLTLSDGTEVCARVVVGAVGALRDPRLPDLPGIETFAGPSMHSARWDPTVDLDGKRVGVVGTGASAIQVVPAIADRVAELRVYQRTPPWVQRRDDRAYTAREKARLREIPGALAAKRLATWLENEVHYPLVFGRLHALGRRIAEPLFLREMAHAVKDPELVRALTPSYDVGCKRILLSDDWYPTLTRPHVHLVTRRITEVVPTGLRLDDGRVDSLDVLVWCTGFRVDRPMGQLVVEGVDGRDLAAWWGDRPRAYLGIHTPHFPNLFLLLGPNTALGHSSVVIMIEAQIRYVLGALRHLDTHPGAMDVLPEALDDFMAEVDARHAHRVWSTGCDSWYLSHGQNFTIWPGSTPRYIARTWSFDPKVVRMLPSS